MRRLFLLLLIVALASPALAQVNGETYEKEGFTIIRVWGSHYEMGFAEGHFIAPKLKDLIEKYVLQQIPPLFWNAARAAYPTLFTEPSEIQEELRGFIDGAVASGEDIYLEPLGRNVDILDLKVANTIADLSTVDYFCSSFSAFGEATQDSELDGALAISRNLDWAAWNDEDPFLLSRDTFILVRRPSEPGYQPTVAITYPGFVGCLSCINQAGVGAFMNQGNNDLPQFLRIWNDGPYVPVVYAVREGLESADFNGDMISTADDVIEALQDKFYGTNLVHIVEPYQAPAGPAGVMEMQTLAGYTIRMPEDDADIGPWRLGLTNQSRKLFPPDPCWRYDAIVQNVQSRSGRYDLDAMWEIMGLVALYDLEQGYTNQTMLYRTDTLELGLAKTDDEGFSVEKQPVWFGIEDLINPTPPVDDDTMDDADDSEDDDSEPTDDDDNDEGNGNSASDDDDEGNCCG